jgi:hypothetical protein
MKMGQGGSVVSGSAGDAGAQGASTSLVRCTSKAGTICPVAYSSAPLLDGSTICGVVVVFRDTSAEQADEDRVRRGLDTLAWVGRIRDALDEDRLVLHSQPIVPLAGGQPSQELLLRMIGSGGELILPSSSASQLKSVMAIRSPITWRGAGSCPYDCTATHGCGGACDLAVTLGVAAAAVHGTR